MSFSTALIGECMIELQEVEPGVTKQTFGGDTLNTAMYMARLAKYFPAKVDYVTALGVDTFSDRMVAFWEAEGVGSDLVLRQEGESPGLYYIQLDEDGERHLAIGAVRLLPKNVLSTKRAKRYSTALVNTMRFI